jgi:hypothetical protein
LTAPHPITPTSPSCPSAWQPNPGRRSTYRRGKAVQTTGPTSHSIRCFFQFGRTHLVIRSVPERWVRETADCNPPEECIPSKSPRTETGAPLWIILQRWYFSHCLESLDARCFAPRLRGLRWYKYTRPQIEGEMPLRQLNGPRRRSTPRCDEDDGGQIVVAHPLEQPFEKFEAGEPRDT